MSEPEAVFITADEGDAPPPSPEAFDIAKEQTIASSEDVEPQGIAAQETRRSGISQAAQRPSRPPLRRDKSAPQPAGTWIELQRSNLEVSQDPVHEEVQSPGLWNPSETVGNPTDSLSLGQLKKLVQEVPRVEPTPYAFEYEDCPSFEADVEDLFGYGWQDRRTHLNARETFGTVWRDFRAPSAERSAYEDGLLDWCTADGSTRRQFLDQLGPKIASEDDGDRMDSLECIFYLALGCWYETAGLPDPLSAGRERTTYANGDMAEDPEYESAGLQTRYMRENVELIIDANHAPTILNIFFTSFLPTSPSEDGEQLGHEPDMYQRRERLITQVLVYLFIDLARRESMNPLGRKLQDALRPFESRLLMFLTDLLVKTRWDDQESLPPARVLQLYWKTILLEFGGTSDIERIKDAFARNGTKDPDRVHEARITASPLDYHVFRQEIISKYPAYNPPPALFPFEPDNNSFLPPLQDVLPRNGNNSSNSNSVGPANILGAGTSILNQPVHIATPAPSPPPSPAGPGGKGLKKHNYQTNQMFPFLYPPLDESSNDLGGKGTTELQDLLAGRKWHGSDVPASILEAADLFAKRMRATRVMKQLWEERVRFMKFEQGYGSLDSVNGREMPSNGENGGLPVAEGDDYSTLDDDMRHRLDAVETFYKDVLPRLQSVVIVLLKTLVQTITTLITQAEGLEGVLPNGPASELTAESASGGPAEANSFNRTDVDDDPTFQELTIMRRQEIISKAVSGILLLLLKWFKISHVLKFEYLSQLLLDSNYIQFTLKLFTHQELDRVVSYRCERKDLNFFAFCCMNSRNANAASTKNEDSEEEEDEDNAEPPPISLNRVQANRSSPPQAPSVLEAAAPLMAPTPAPTQPPPNPPGPEVDELGYALPSSPITHYSWRTFFTSINYLRILQKIIKAKPHRQLLMVQGKYSNTLKKHLRVPQSDVRLYTLKIIKGQVPYCHRKWRQSNMRIITAIYLHVKPGLRDEWLSGLDVEQEVGEALPAEQALRALTYWYNLRRYPAQMGMAESASVSASVSALPPGIAGKFSEDFTFDSDTDFTALDSAINRAQDLQVLMDNNPETEADSNNNDLALTTDSMNLPSSIATKDYNPAQPPPLRSSTNIINPAPRLQQPSLQQTAPPRQQPGIPPLMLREQDFFLRELEKMDLGLSIPSPSGSRSSSRPSSRPVSSSGEGPVTSNMALDHEAERLQLQMQGQSQIYGQSQGQPQPPPRMHGEVGAVDGGTGARMPGYGIAISETGDAGVGPGLGTPIDESLETVHTKGGTAEEGERLIVGEQQQPMHTEAKAEVDAWDQAQVQAQTQTQTQTTALAAAPEGA